MNPYGAYNGQNPFQQYNGDNAYGAYAKQSWLGAVNQSISPFYKDPIGGNPVSNNSEAFGSVASKPMDAAAWVGQRIAMPALVMGAMNKYGRGAAGAFSAGVGRGVASSLGASSGAAAMAGSAAGMIGQFALPFIGGLAAAEIASRAVFEPYARTRQIAEQTHRNFAGITFTDATGNSVSGRGLSFGESARYARGVNSLGINDMTFSSAQMASLTGMGQRAGLFDDVGASQMLKRTKEIASQVKVLMAISKDLDIQGAVQQLAALRLGGASLSGGAFSAASMAYSSMGMHASIGGVSVTDLMNRVGAPGSQMFQNAGMTPYLGALAASSVFGGFSSAMRTGAVSMSTMARLGGIDNASLSAMGGMMSSAGSTYGRMGQYNRFFGGGQAGSMVENVSRFGATAARDPVGTMGNMMLYEGAMASAELSDPSGKAAEARAVQFLQASGIRPNKDGKYSAAHIAMGLAGTGMSPEQVRAFVAMRAGATDRGSVAQSLKAIQAQSTEQLQQVSSQDFMYNTALGRPLRSVIKGAHRSLDFAGSVGGFFAEQAGMTADLLQDAVSDLVYGGTSGRSTARRDDGSDVSLAGVGDLEKITKYSKKGMTSLDHLKIIGQAQGVMSLSQTTGVELSTLLAKPEYKELSEVLSGMGNKTQLAMVRQMNDESAAQGYYGAGALAARGRSLAFIRKAQGGGLKGMKQNRLGLDATPEERARGDSALMADALANEKVIDASSGAADYSEFTKASRAIDESSQRFVTAADTIERAASKLSGGAGGNSDNQKSSLGWHSIFRSR